LECGNLLILLSCAARREGQRSSAMADFRNSSQAVCGFSPPAEIKKPAEAGWPQAF